MALPTTSLPGWRSCAACSSSRRGPFLPLTSVAWGRRRRAGRSMSIMWSADRCAARKNASPWTSNWSSPELLASCGRTSSITSWTMPFWPWTRSATGSWRRSKSRSRRPSATGPFSGRRIPWTPGRPITAAFGTCTASTGPTMSRRGISSRWRCGSIRRFQGRMRACLSPIGRMRSSAGASRRPPSSWPLKQPGRV
ncbi:hypothetical protein D3C85_1267030 [compost metagenome]